MKVRLNKRTIDEATYQGPGACYLWDTELAAFGLRIYPTGRKSFVVSYWSRGRRRFHVLGQYGRLTLAQAREAALEVFLRVRRGDDPAGDRQAARRTPTVADLADRHIDEHAKIKKRRAAPSGTAAPGTDSSFPSSASARSRTSRAPMSPV